MKIHLFHIVCDLIKAKKKKLLYWRNPTDPKIRPDPTFFFKKPKKKKDKKMTDRS